LYRKVDLFHPVSESADVVSSIEHGVVCAQIRVTIGEQQRDRGFQDSGLDQVQRKRGLGRL